MPRTFQKTWPRIAAGLLAAGAITLTAGCGLFGPSHPDIDTIHANAAKAVTLLEQEAGMKPVAAQGIVANLVRGAGHLDPTDPVMFEESANDGQKMYGIAGWNSASWDQEAKFAAQRDTDPKDLTTQLGFLVQDLRTNHPRLLAQLNAATSNNHAATGTYQLFDAGFFGGDPYDTPSGGLAITVLRQDK